MKAKITGILWLCALLLTDCGVGTVFAEPSAGTKYDRAKQAVQSGKSESKAKTDQPQQTQVPIQESKQVTPADAAKEAERVRKEIVAKSEKPDVYIARGMVFDGMREYKNAIANYDFAIYLNPKLWQAYYQRALDRHILGDDEGALIDLEQVMSINPRYADAYYQRGLILSHMGDYVEAIMNFEKAATLSVAIKGKAEQGIGIANYYLKQYGIAKSKFEAAAAIDPSNAINYVWLGRLRAEERDYKGALELYNKAIALNPEYSAAYLFKGRTLAFFMKNYDEGIMAFSKAIETDPDYADAYLQRAYAYNQKGNGKLAKADFDKAVALDHNLKEQVLPAYRGDGKNLPKEKSPETKPIVVTVDKQNSR